ncbi:MAG: DUF4340 domain-containing protein [Chthoniobacterales bacterium]
MKYKTTLILLCLVTALGVWIKFYESQRPNTEEAKRRAGNLLNFDRDKLEGVEIQNGEDTITLRRAKGKWRVEAPIQDQADAQEVTKLLADLESWEKDETISAKEIAADKNRLAEYDLVKPKLRLKLLGKEMPPEILFGKDAALENRTYVRFENSPETFLVRQSVKKDIEIKPEEFRDRKLTEITTAQVTRVVLKTPAGEMELQKHGEDWEIVKPLRARADNLKIGDLLAQVTSARIEQFVADDRGDLRPYGLAEPRGAITLFTADEADGRTLQIGASPEKEKEQVYVRFSARSFVYTLPKKIEAILAFTPGDLRDRHLIRIATDVLDRITIEAPGRPKTVLARKDRNWTIANLENRPANSAEVTRLLETLKNEQVTKFVEDVASDLPKYGLDQPQLRLTFSSFASENTAESKAGEEPFATVAFGRTEGDNVYARVGEEPFIVTVRRRLLDDIFSDPVQWQETSIFKFKPEEVHRLTVSTDRVATLVRSANEQWTREGGNEPINKVHLESLLDTLTKLRAVRWIGGEMPAQAFDMVQITIEFTTSPDDKAAHKLIVGGPAGDGMWYARVEGQPGVFVLSNPDFNALRLPLMAEATPAPASAQSTTSPTPSPSTSPSVKE